VIVELARPGATLALDNCRAAIVPGPLPFRLGRAVQVALMFGIGDGLAPLVDRLLGKYLGEAVEPVSDYIGPAVMGASGVYLLVCRHCQLGWGSVGLGRAGLGGLGVVGMVRLRRSVR
jgi:hypothetical protein